MVSELRSGHILLITGAAPYLGGPGTWASLREAAQDLAFREVDLLEIPPGDDPALAMKDAITAAADGAPAIVAHGTAAAIVLDAVRDVSSRVPVLLLSPIAVTKDSLALRLARALLRGPAGRMIASVATAKRGKLLKDRAYLRKQLALLVRDDAITPHMLQEAYQRVADPRMEAFCKRTADTLVAVLTPTGLFERFNGLVLFGSGRVDTKARKRIKGRLLPSARSAPMIEAPAQVADALRALLLERTPSLQ